MKSLFVSSSSSTPSHMNVLLASAVCLLMLLGCSSTVEAKPVVVTKCSAGYSLSITPCSKSATSSAPLGGSGYCCSCPGGSFSDGTTCKTCSASTPSTTVSGVDTQKWGAVCFCLDGFGDYDLNTMSCRRCPANTYSSNNKCVPCAAGTFAAAQSSVCAAVKCPADSYLPPGGATVSDCTRCKFGTAGQSCSNVQGCRCSAGYAAFNKTTGACQACANTNSIAVYANFDKPDETNTVCANCPTGTVASSDRRTCTATTATGTGSSTTTTSTGTTNKAATTATTTSTTTSTTSSSTSTTTSTTTTPYPSNPIPLLTCPGSSFTGCIGGYDYEITISQLQATAVTTLNHAMATTAAAASITLDKRTPWSVSGNYVFTDETDIPIAALTYTQTAGQFFTKNQAAFRSKFADTCGQTMYNLGVMGTCVKLKSGAAATSIKTAFATTSNLATNFDVAVKATCYAGSALVTQCSTTATASTSTTTTTATASTVSMTLLDTSKTTTSIITVASTTNSAGVSYAISGSGTSSFGSNVIAIVDANNIVKFVLAAPPNNNKGNVLITTAHAAYGKTCAKGVNNVAACVALNYQLTDVAPDMNNVVKGAANSPLLIAGSCTNNN